MGAIKIASRGGQNHKPSRVEIENIYAQALISEVSAEQQVLQEQQALKEIVPANKLN